MQRHALGLRLQIIARENDGLLLIHPAGPADELIFLDQPRQRIFDFIHAMRVCFQRSLVNDSRAVNS